MNPARRRSALSLGAAVIGLVSLTGCQLHPNDNTLPGQVAVGDDGYTVTVYFDRIENLVANSTVQRDDVTIGTVAKVEVDDWKAKVTLRLKRSVRIPGNAIFSIMVSFHAEVESAFDHQDRMPDVPAPEKLTAEEVAKQPMF